MDVHCDEVNWCDKRQKGKGKVRRKKCDQQGVVVPTRTQGLQPPSLLRMPIMLINGKAQPSSHTSGSANGRPSRQRIAVAKFPGHYMHCIKLYQVLI
eukprot:1159898-Pelagomonas_calceolata.AAC.2